MAVRGPDERPRTLRQARATARSLLAADFGAGRTWYPLSRVTLWVWRHGQALRYTRGPAAWLARRLVLVADLLWTQVFMGAEFPHECWAGPGVKLEHGGRGVILHPSVQFGERVTIYHGVTVGVRDDRPAAVVGDRVFLGAGAVVLGPVRLGDGCRIGANAVVTRDTDPDTTYAGVPAVAVGPPVRRGP